MGGQGGGVLTDWIVALAEAQGFAAQSTSVPGVAQRTGATIYYVEMLPPRDGVAPILSLMPTPGDVDVVIAAEMMEAGRSILRGLVTPDRTVMIASTGIRSDRDDISPPQKSSQNRNPSPEGSFCASIGVTGPVCVPTHRAISGSGIDSARAVRRYAKGSDAPALIGCCGTQ